MLLVQGWKSSNLHLRNDDDDLVTYGHEVALRNNKTQRLESNMCYIDQI